MVPVLILLQTLSSQLTTEATSQIADLGNDRYEITINGLDADERVSQAAVAQIAEQICGKKQSSLGRFRSDRTIPKRAEDRVPPAVFVQEIACSGSRATSPTASQDVAPAKVVVDPKVNASATGFLRLRDRGDGVGTWMMLSSGMKEQQSRAEWLGLTRQHATAIGTNASTRVVKLTRYTNPPGMPQGTYIAADFTGSSPKAALICGYIVLHEGPSGRWEITRLESGVAPIEVLDDTTPEQLREIRSTLRCVDG